MFRTLGRGLILVESYLDEHTHSYDAIACNKKNQMENPLLPKLRMLNSNCTLGIVRIECSK